MHKSIWGYIFSISIVVWIVWALLAIEPKERLDRACKPVDWTKNLFVSGAALLAPSYQTNVSSTFDKIDYSCQYMLWRLVYEDDYKEAVDEEAGAEVKEENIEVDPFASPSITVDPADVEEIVVSEEDYDAAE